MKYMSLSCRRVISKLLQQQQDVLGSNGFFKGYGFMGSIMRGGRYFTTETTTVEQEGEEEGSDVVSKKGRKVECPENSRLMKIAIIGVPNAGKSTIINALTNYNVCPVSRRPHTTRENQKAVYLDENTQLVFVDTPGVVNVKEIKKFSFTNHFVYGPEKSIGTSHVIAVIHDVSRALSRDKLDPRIKRVLEKFPDKKSILILNKIDTVKKKSTLLDTVKYLTSGIVGGKPLPVRTFEEKKQSHKPLDKEALLSRAKQRYENKQALEKCATKEELDLQIASKFFTKDEITRGFHQMGWPNFHDIFMISALQGDGVEMLRRYLVVNAVPHDWLYDADTLTDVPPQKLVLSILRSKLLEYLPQEVPFKVQPVLEFWQEDDSGILSISYQIRCPRERYQYMILGTGGELINSIIKSTEKTISELLFRPVRLTLNPIFDKTLANQE